VRKGTHGTLKEPFYFNRKDNVKMHNQEQDATCNKYARFITEELLSIFKVEAQHICKKFDEVHSIAVSTLNDFTKNHGKYVSFYKSLQLRLTCLCLEILQVNPVRRLGLATLDTAFLNR
jgi:hypothetical protein